MQQYIATSRRMRGFRAVSAAGVLCSVLATLRTFRAAVSVPSTSNRAMMRGFLVTDMVQREYGRMVWWCAVQWVFL